MKKLAIAFLAAALLAPALVHAQTTVTNRGVVITQYTMEDGPESTETNMANTYAVWAVDVTDDADVGGDLDVTGNAAVGGTLAVTGVATFTAESVHNLGIDADYITTDAAAGIDTKTAGTLLIGAATADKVEIADAAVETEVQGTFQAVQAATFDSTVLITGVATLSVAPVLTVTEAAQAQTLTMTNAPAAATAGKDTPIYIEVVVGATTYVVPAWPLSE